MARDKLGELTSEADFTNLKVERAYSQESTKRLSDLIASRKATSKKKKEGEKTRDSLGELEAFESDFTDLDVDAAYSPESTKRLSDLIASRKKVEKYNPNQPRDPAGTPTGGQWSSSRAGGAFRGTWTSRNTGVHYGPWLSTREAALEWAINNARYGTRVEVESGQDQSGGNEDEDEVSLAQHIDALYFDDVGGGGEQNIGFIERTRWAVEPSSRFNQHKEHILSMFREFGNTENAFLDIKTKYADTQLNVLLTGKVEGQPYLVERIFKVDGDSGKLWVDHNMFELPQSAQGKGIGKRFLRDSMRAYQNMGVDRVELLANSDIGRYAWAKYGFKPSVDEWRSPPGALTGIFNYYAEETGNKLLIDRVKQATAKGPEGIWDVADLTIPINGVPAGKSLMKYKVWSGSLDLKDQKAMDRFWNYVGGRNG